MKYETFEELNKNYPEREEMDFDEEVSYVADCFDTYEHTGFSDVFQTPYDENADCNGMKFTVDGRVSYSNGEADLECLPMWHITLENGKHIDAYPEEICKVERNVA